MDIIVFNDKRGRTRNIRIPKFLIGFGALVIAAAVVGNVVLVDRFVNNELFDDQIVTKWRQKLDTHQREVDELSGRAQDEMTAVGRRMAAMEARLLRMEALGERVSEAANLTDGEFRFDEPAPVGGPENAMADAEAGTGSDYLVQVGELSHKLKARERELEVLESLLSNRRFNDEAAPAGRPVKWGWMSSPYGRRVDPISGKPAWHAGIDFAGKPSSDVIAVASGVVVFSGKRSGYGHMIDINHGGGYTTRYGHHEKVLVGLGDIVKKGQVIAAMGSTGRSTGPHVHFEVLKNGRHINPAKYVARR